MKASYYIGMLAAIMVASLVLVVPLVAQGEGPPPAPAPINWNVKAPNNSTEDIAVNAGQAQDWVVENDAESAEDVVVEIYIVDGNEEQIVQTVDLDPGERKQIGLQQGQSMRVKDTSNQGGGANGTATRVTS